ncbi:MAG: response regulator transcription factor [Alphaproteobacteria bacterium]|nr:response regulator transcription factor [Alphaproteobacteria bacterium]
MARVHVIDEDEAERATVGAALRKRGHEVMESSAAPADLESLGDSDLVVADIRARNLDGLDVIRRLCGERRERPIVLALAGRQGRVGARTVLDLAKGLGADATVAKPVSGEQLANVVARLLTKGVAGHAD